MPAVSRIAHHGAPSLKDQLAEAQERIRQLEAELGAGEIVPRCLQLTPHQARILGVILRRPIASRSAIMLVAYSEHGDAPEEGVVDVHLFKIRARLKPFGLTIHTRYAAGFWMTDKDKDRIRAMAAEEAGA